MLDDRRRQAVVLAVGALCALGVSLAQTARHAQIDAERALQVVLLLVIFVGSMLPLMVAEAYFEDMPRALIRRAAAIGAAGNMLLWLIPGELPVIVIAGVIAAQLLSCAIYYEAASYVLAPPEPRITV
jgi:hypothetical protein